MLDGILKSKFYTKCKSAIKMTKTRIEMIRNKRNAMQKYLRNDIADLLKAGLDVNAYGRAEGFILELNLSSCYDLVEHFCGCVSTNLSLMSKQRECPDEGKEAVGSLMFAAARFADLPELRELRSTFAERFGNSLEVFANNELITKLKSMPPTKEMKLQLLHDIASEIGKDWNPKVLEQKLYNQPVHKQDNAKDTNGIKYNIRGSRNESIRKTHENDAGHVRGSARDNASPKKKDGIASYGQKLDNKDGNKLQETENNVPQKNQLGRLFYGPLKNSDSVKHGSKGENNDNNTHGHYRSIPPPYSKPNASKNGTNLEPTLWAKADHKTVDEAVKPMPLSVRRRVKPPISQDETKCGLQILNEDVVESEEEEKIMERMMDRLLLHYSTKEKEPVQQAAVNGSNKAATNKNKDPPARAFSLPPEPVTPANATRGPSRAASFQPESNHVHPKLPDYDDFVARLAALRGK